MRLAGKMKIEEVFDGVTGEGYWLAHGDGIVAEGTSKAAAQAAYLETYAARGARRGQSFEIIGE